MEYPLEIHVGWGDDFQETVEVNMIFRDENGRPMEVALSAGASLGEVMRYRDSRIGHMTRRSAQWLMDRLWGLGFRPSDDGTPGQLKAMSDHLQDMRLMSNQLLNFVLINFGGGSRD